MTSQIAQPRPINTTGPDFSGYDFIDFGCSNGESITWVKRVFPHARGIGIDLSPKKVANAKALGFDVVVMNAVDVKSTPRVVDFCILSHFLEHLDGYNQARGILMAAGMAARKFIFIRHPWFGADQWLFDNGFKFFWSDWRGHPFHMDVLQLQTALRDIRLEGAIKEFAIFGNSPVKDSRSTAIHPLESPIDQVHYDASIHPPKTFKEFPDGIFHEVFAVAVVDGNLDEVSKLVGAGKGLYDSRHHAT